MSLTVLVLAGIIVLGLCAYTYTWYTFRKISEACKEDGLRYLGILNKLAEDLGLDQFEDELEEVLKNVCEAVRTKIKKDKAKVYDLRGENRNLRDRVGDYKKRLSSCLSGKPCQCMFQNNIDPIFRHIPQDIRSPPTNLSFLNQQHSHDVGNNPVFGEDTAIMGHKYSEKDKTIYAQGQKSILDALKTRTFENVHNIINKEDILFKPTKVRCDKKCCGLCKDSNISNLFGFEDKSWQNNRSVYNYNLKIGKNEICNGLVDEILRRKNYMDVLRYPNGHTYNFVNRIYVTTCCLQSKSRVKSEKNRAIQEINEDMEKYKKIVMGLHHSNIELKKKIEDLRKSVKEDSIDSLKFSGDLLNFDEPKTDNTGDNTIADQSLTNKSLINQQGDATRMADADIKKDEEIDESVKDAKSKDIGTTSEIIEQNNRLGEDKLLPENTIIEEKNKLHQKLLDTSKMDTSTQTEKPNKRSLRNILTQTDLDELNKHKFDRDVSIQTDRTNDAANNLLNNKKTKSELKKTRRFVSLNDLNVEANQFSDQKDLCIKNDYKSLSNKKYIPEPTQTSTPKKETQTYREHSFFDDEIYEFDKNKKNSADRRKESQLSRDSGCESFDNCQCYTVIDNLKKEFRRLLSALKNLEEEKNQINELYDELYNEYTKLFRLNEMYKHEINRLKRQVELLESQMNLDEAEKLKAYNLKKYYGELFIEAANLFSNCDGFLVENKAEFENFASAVGSEEQEKKFNGSMRHFIQFYEYFRRTIDSMVKVCEKFTDEDDDFDYVKNVLKSVQNK